MNIQVSTKPNDEIYRTTIRGCSNFNELLELYLYVNASTPQPSFFAEELQTSFILDMNKFVQYRLPYLEDEGSDEAPGVHVRRFNGTRWPPFISYINETRLLQFWPNSFWFKGNTYTIEVVVTGPQQI
jgi:hypothetical protein